VAYEKLTIEPVKSIGQVDLGSSEGQR
jgi:hypothetical protein